jgi:hypothetical protein
MYVRICINMFAYICMHCAVCVFVLPLFVRSFLSLYENPPTDAVPSDIANVILNIILEILIL